MGWIGQHIYDLVSRFRNDVYLEDISTGTIASGAHLGLDSNNKIVKAVDGGGDLTSIVAGTGLSGTSLTGPIPTLNVDASQTQITSVGTITEGTWRGAIIASDHLDTDTAHLSGTQTFTGAKTFSAATTTFSSATTDSPLIKILNTTDDDQASQLIFEKLRDDDAVAVGQNLGEIWFRGQDAAQNTEDYAYIFAEINVSTSGQESGQLKFGVANHDGGNGNGLILTGGSENNEIDVTVGLGANSVVTIPGTIGTGVWNGTAIAHAYIGNDAIDGDNLADEAVDSEHYTDGSIDTGHIADDAVTPAKLADSINAAIAVNTAKSAASNIYGSIIKVLPSDFMANEEPGVTKTLQFVDNSVSGIKPGDNNTELLAFVSIPEGMKATHVDVYADDTLAFSAYEFNIHESVGDISAASKGTGNCNTTLDITDVNATATNYLLIQVVTVSKADRVFGAKVTIATQ